MLKQQKSQGSLEFIVLIGIMLGIMTLSIGVMNIQFQKTYRNILYNKVSGLITYIDTEIQLAESAKDGYQKIISLPHTVAGRDYDINLNPDYQEITVSVEGNDFVLYIPIKVVGNITKGRNIIKKEGDKINITGLGFV